MSLLIRLVNFAARLFILLILLRVAATWLDPERKGKYHHWLTRLTEPVLMPIRKLIGRRGARYDLAPLVAAIGVELARAVVVWIL